MWARMSVEELVKSSNIIVIGELVSIKMLSDSQSDRGKIKIEKVIVGDKNLKEVFIAMPSSQRKIQSSSDIIYHRGQKGLWFLRLIEIENSDHPGKIYLADHPQRFQPVENVKQIQKYLQSHP